MKLKQSGINRMHPHNNSSMASTERGYSKELKFYYHQNYLSYIANHSPFKRYHNDIEAQACSK
jgi:hypothetical protein